MDKIDSAHFRHLCLNPNAIHIIERNMDKIDEWFLSENPNAMHLLFPLDKEKIKFENAMFKEELYEYFWNPDRLENICKAFNIPLRDYLSMF